MSIVLSKKTRVTTSITRTWNLPVLGIAATEDDLDDNLVFAGLGNVGVDDVDLGASGDKSFLHVVWRMCDIS